MKPRILLVIILILLFIPLSIPGHTAVLFEREFVRGTGAPVTESDTFSSEFGGPGIAKVCNGGAEDATDEKVSSSEVYINGELIFGPHNFNQNVQCIQTPITFNQGDGNYVDCKLKSKPGGKIWLQLTQAPLRITNVDPNIASPGELVTINFTGDIDDTQLWAVFNSLNINTAPSPAGTNAIIFQAPEEKGSGPLYIQQGARVSNSVSLSVSEEILISPDPEYLVIDSKGKKVAVNLLYVIMKDGYDSQEEAQRIAALHEGIIVGRFSLVNLWQIEFPVSSLEELSVIEESLEADSAVDYAMKYFHVSGILATTRTDWPLNWQDDQELFLQRASNRVKEGVDTYKENVSPGLFQNRVQPHENSILVFEWQLDYSAADFNGYANNSRSNDIGINALGGGDVDNTDHNRSWLHHGSIVSGMIAAEVDCVINEVTGQCSYDDQTVQLGLNAGLLHALGNSHSGFDIYVSAPSEAPKPINTLHHINQKLTDHQNIRVVNLSLAYRRFNNEGESLFTLDEWTELTTLFVKTLKRWKERYPNRIFVACAHNFSNSISSNLLDQNFYLPQSIHSDNLLVAGGHHYPPELRNASYSNYGNRVDISAASKVRASYLDQNGNPKNVTGTSYAAPLVTATVAAMQSINPNLIPSEIRHLLRKSAQAITNEVRDKDGKVIPGAVFTDPLSEDEVGPGDSRVGLGARLNVEGAIQAAILSVISPKLSSPENGEPDVPHNEIITLEWFSDFIHNNQDVSISFPFEYCAVVNDSQGDSVYSGCEDGEFTDQLRVEITDPVAAGFKPGETYYWAVWAKDSNGCWSKAPDSSAWFNFTTACIDNDGDTYDTCEPGDPGDDGKPQDCNDEDENIYPGAKEICDNENNDCDETTADGSEEEWFGDACDGPDSDQCLEGTLVCSSGDPLCNDNTGDNVETCDGIDNDCNPSTADGAAEPWIGDACDGPDSDQCLEGTLVCSSGDPLCNDNTGDNVEICDGLDNDCDGQVDEDVTTIFYLDSDYDDYGDPAISINDCLPPAGYVANNTDCDDANSSVYPGAQEICDVIDNQCPGDPGYGQVDEGCDEDIPRNGLVAFYPFSGNANDESGNENHGTVYGAVLSKDRFGNDNQAYYFDGVDDYIEVADDPTLNFGIGDFTINAWVKTNYAHFLPSIVIIDKRTHTDGFWYGYVLFHIEDGRIGFQLADGGYSNWFSHLLITTDKWQLITVTVDRDVEIGGKIYVNGQIIHTFPTSYDTGSLDNISNLFIAQNLFGSNHFRGNIDDISMYNRVLSDEEVQTLFHIGQIEDYDGDGVIDTLDNCPEDFNPGQDDADDNGIGDYCESPSLRALPDTGQVSSYTETFGEDSDYNSNQPSFTKLDINGNALPYSSPLWPMVRDNVTGLTWETKTVDGSIHDRDNKYNWQDAQDNFIFQLNADQFGGFNDWRLPNIKELLTIVNREINPNSGIPVINTDFFSNTIKGYYWSSTLTADTGTGAWTTNFYYGLAQPPGVGSLNPVRAVRGAPYGENNFIVGEGFVTDTNNGLMWQQETIDPMTWEETLSYCEDLQLSGYDDWRLPSINELHSIVDYSVINPSIDSTVFPDTVPNSIYWSSTTTPHASNHAWSIRFTAGYVYAFTKTDTVYLDLTIYGRCVRGGQN